MAHAPLTAPGSFDDGTRHAVEAASDGSSADVMAERDSDAGATVAAHAAMRARLHVVADRAVTVVLCAAILGFAGVLIARTFGYRTLVVRSGSMTPTLAVGDVVVARAVHPGAVRRGDIVTFRDPALQNQLVTHRVVSTVVRGTTVAFVTKGDANSAAEHWSIAAHGTIGKEIVVLPAVGRVLHRIESPIAITIAMALILLWLIFVALRWIWLDGSPRSRSPDNGPNVTNAGMAGSRRWLRIGGTAMILACVFAAIRISSTAAAWVGTNNNNANTFTSSTSFATISSVALQNKTGGTAGQIEKGDQIIVVFSKTMKVSSFCSTWSGDNNDQSLTGNGDVTITVLDGTGATKDSITVASGTCTFHFGSIDLGTNTYVSGGNATFSGNGTNKSTITWTAATKALNITLGAKTGGTLNTVASSTAVYTASASITSPAGGILTNTPYALATGQYF